MAAIDDLRAAVSALNTSLGAELDAINAKLSSLPTGTSDADIAGVVADLTALKDKLDAETARLTVPADG